MLDTTQNMGMFFAMFLSRTLAIHNMVMFNFLYKHVNEYILEHGHVSGHVPL